jgi:hypothetical protein
MPIPQALKRFQQVWRGELLTGSCAAALVADARQQAFTLGWGMGWGVGYARGLDDGRYAEQVKEEQAEELWASLGRPS